MCGFSRSAARDVCETGDRVSSRLTGKGGNSGIVRKIMLSELHLSKVGKSQLIISSGGLTSSVNLYDKRSSDVYQFLSNVSSYYRLGVKLPITGKLGVDCVATSNPSLSTPLIFSRSFSRSVLPLVRRLYTLYSYIISHFNRSTSISAGSVV